MRLLALVLSLAACGPRNPAAAEQCKAAGGHCEIAYCRDGGTRLDVDCNPDHNPGGAVCCPN